MGLQDFVWIIETNILLKINLHNLELMIFSKMNLRIGYHHIHVKYQDVPKMAFKTIYGHYKFMVMSFGLTSSPTTFITLMNSLF